MIKEITVWYLVQDSCAGKLAFNHISDGFDPQITEPTPGSAAQIAAWRSREWHPRHALLIDGAIIETEQRNGNKWWMRLRAKILRVCFSIKASPIGATHSRS